jgi:hypothetical protein
MQLPLHISKQWSLGPIPHRALAESVAGYEIIIKLQFRISCLHLGEECSIFMTAYRTRLAFNDVALIGTVSIYNGVPVPMEDH